MRIGSSSIGMESARSFSSVTVNSAFTYLGRARSFPLRGGKGFLGSSLGMGEETKNRRGSGNTPNSLRDMTLHFQNLTNAGRISEQNEEKDMKENLRQNCMKYLMYLLFGERHKEELDELWGESSGQNVSSSYLADGFTNQTYTAIQSCYHSETETTSFATQGIVKTQDGREINFDLELTMSRSFSRYYEEKYQYTVPKMTDPLVINLEGNVAELSAQKFFFDLDCDGEEEEIAMLQSGSGYLALDKNKNGVINDGSELFGAKSGDGFADLARYDEDGNGWIDENDAIWKQLLIWTKDEDGNDKQYHLSDAGVGAICLNSEQTEYSLNSEKDNQNRGVIRRTGIFLYENGSVGTLQHLDLARFDSTQ